MSDIYEAVQEAVFNFRMSTGGVPKALYLGSLQHAQLHQRLNQYAHFPASKDPKRPEYCGLQVYLVDATDYLAVGH